MFENVNIDWNLSHDDGSTDFSDEETLDDHPRTLTRTPDKKVLRPMSIYTPVMNGGGENDESPENNRSHGSSSDWSRSNTSDSGDSPGSYRNSIMPPPPPPAQSKKPSICKWITASHPIPLIRRARSIAFGFVILSCGREGLVVSSCTCQDTLPLLSKGGNQGALVLVKLNFQTPSPFITHFFSCFHLSLFEFDPRPLAFVLLLHAFHMSFSSCFSYELFQFQPRTLQLTSLEA